DRYMRLMSMVKASQKPLDNRLQGMSRLCLYHLDQFRQMINKMRIFSHVEVTKERQAQIMEDSLEGDVACLDFALDWMELVIFGQAKNLVRK
ncbi:MAG: YkgJ family cysteine cluster protein, partial [Desulfovibrionaceae bacterium]|nr:YkgJ family cysteine cluster protein [Desulfovibrionaceae bacterium]